MELEFKRAQLTGYDTVLDTTVFQEETLETIVPDACPDILRLVDTQGNVLLKSKTASDGHVTLTGTARLAVLYLPEGGTGPCHLQVNIPFSVSVEEKRLKSGCLVTALPRVVSADARTVNPRKVVARVEIAISVQAFQAGGVELCTDLCATGGTMEQRKQRYRPYCICAIQEKPFSVEEDLTIPAGRPTAEEIISSRVTLCCHESKIIGNKLVFKGEATIQLVYRPVGGGMDAADFTLQFSQIAELLGVGEEGTCTVELCMTGIEFALAGDGRTVSAALSLLAQAVVGEERDVEVLADTYSTGCPARVEYADYEYRMRVAQTIGRQTVRQLIETGMTIQSVVDCVCCVGRTHQSRVGDRLRLTAELSLTVLCVTEASEYGAVSRRMEVSCDVDVPEDSLCRFSFRCGDLIAVPTTDGVEVRFSAEFPYLVLRDMRAMVVHDVVAEDCAAQEPVRQPSVVLRALQEGEGLWEVAKQYRTTAQDIIKANQWEGEQPGAGTLLLIPHKR